MGHAFRFRADLPNKVRRGKIGQQQSSNQNGAEDRLRAIQGEISGSPYERQQSRNESLDRKLEQFDRANAGGAQTKSNQLSADWNAAVTKQSITESNLHGIAICISF